MRGQAVVGLVVAVALPPAVLAQTDTKYGVWTRGTSRDDCSGSVTEMAFAAGDSVMLSSTAFWARNSPCPSTCSTAFSATGASP